MSTYYTSGGFVKKAHVSIRTIRYYDQKNLLKPSTHTSSGAWRYTERDFAKLQQILLLKYLVFSLSDIREMTIESGRMNNSFIIHSRFRSASLKNGLKKWKMLSLRLTQLAKQLKTRIRLIGV